MQVLLNDIGNTVIDEVLLYPHCLIEVQWGTGASGKNNLPISFNNILCALAVPNSPLYTYETSITSINKSYINIMTWSGNHGSSTVYYIAIGN